MQLNRLALRGMIGIKKGLGLDEIAVDLAGLNGLIALSGKNGAGKTTFLESLTPYRTLASRKRTLSAHCFMRDSFKELDFDFQGDSYRTRIKIDCDSGKQEGYIWQNGVSIVNGSAREYDRKIEEIFGSKDLFFNSIFCAQNARNLSDLTTGKLKELFSEFLQLDKYIAYEKTVKNCLGALIAQVTTFDRQAEVIRDQLAGFGDLESKLAKAAGEKTGEKGRLANIEEEINKVESSIVTAKEKIAANAAMEVRANDFRQRIKDTETSIEDETDAYNGRVSGLRRDLRKVKTEIVAFDAILEMRDEIERATAWKMGVEDELHETSHMIDRGQLALETIRERIYQHDQTVLPATQPHKREADIPLLKERIRNAESKATELDKRDPECASSVCSFIVGAIGAKGSIDGLKAELDTLQKEIHVHDEQVLLALGKTAEQKTKMQAEETEIIKAIRELKPRLENLKKEQAECTQQVARQDDLKVAIAQKETAEARAQELTDHGMKEKAGFDAKIEQLRTKIEQLNQNFNEITENIDNSVKGRLTELEIVHQNMSDQRKYIIDQINTLEADIQQCQKDIERRTAYREQEAEINLKQVSIQNQINEWTYLRNAVSKDGLRALEIDSVAPSISAYANQILFRTFGPAYSVKLRTQDDEGRETLDILALEEDGRETLLDDLSGGEKVWSLKALRLAMTLISKEKSGKGFLTAMADEEDGALDADNSINFVHMYRAFMKAGGFDSCIFISHRPECVAMADHVLEFANSGISLN